MGSLKLELIRIMEIEINISRIVIMERIQSRRVKVLPKKLERYLSHLPILVLRCRKRRSPICLMILRSLKLKKRKKDKMRSILRHQLENIWNNWRLIRRNERKWILIIINSNN